MAIGLGVGLFERERKLEQLDAALTAVLAGEGRVVVVQGSPGIGKSRLVDALCARADGSGECCAAVAASWSGSCRWRWYGNCSSRWSVVAATRSGPGC